MASTLDAIASDSGNKNEQYTKFLNDAVAANNIVACKHFIDHMLSESVPLVLSRSLLTNFAHALQQLVPDAQKTVALYSLEKISPRAVSYEEQSAAIREQLAQVYEAQEEWSRAAQTLAGVDLDSGMRVLEPEYKLSKLVKIAMLYLEDDDAVSAETYIKKASSLLSSCKNEELELQYKTCYARVLDSKRRFLEAATRYYELSQIGQRVIGGRMVQEEDLAQALSAAATCTILAAAGPQRSRMLAILYKDERAAKLPVYPFLEKVYLERLLKPEEVAAFAETLAPHQVAVLPDGATVLERSVMEHNLEAASKLYNNVYIPELAELLGVPLEKAEAAAARMVQEKRLQGSIDQVEELLIFGTAAGAIEQWDKNIEGLCRVADVAVEAAAAKGLLMRGGGGGGADIGGNVAAAPGS